MEKALSQIFADLKKNKLSHAILIDGGTAADREQAARIAAQAMVCVGDDKPCGVCPQCVKALAGAHADILTYSGGSTPGSFKVDTVREVRRNAGILPNEASVKVFLLLGCESMLAGAQNALLKILEEPPHFIRFILTCGTASALLDTILSCVTVYSLSSPSDAPTDEAHEAAMQKAREILEIAANQDETAMLRATAALEKDKDALRLTCQSLYALSAQALTYKCVGSSDDPFVQTISARISQPQLMHYMDTAGQTIQAIQANINGNLLLARFCAMLFADPNERI